MGDAKLKRTPACAYTFSSNCLASTSNSLLYSFKKLLSILTPSNSISASTRTSGFSTFSKTRSTSFSFNKGTKTCFNCNVISASSPAYSVICSTATSRMLPWFFPFLPMSASMCTGSYPKYCALSKSILRLPSGSIT